ncbi:MAG: hypothetical protein HUJ56_06810 [Erysipelotrichaceae bacterium]|nr:hypothetical protein [Erysipelotrichaceae bacterium]
MISEEVCFIEEALRDAEVDEARIEVIVEKASLNKWDLVWMLVREERGKVADKLHRDQRCLYIIDFLLNRIKDHDH